MLQFPAIGIAATMTHKPASIRLIGMMSARPMNTSGMTIRRRKVTRYRRGLVNAARISLCAREAPIIIIAIGVLMEPMEASALSTGSGSRQPVRPKNSAISAETTPRLTIFRRLMSPLPSSSMTP